MANNNGEYRTIYVENMSRERFEAKVPCGSKLSKVAGDFFESQAWPLQDHRGRGQRAVVELVNPKDADDTKRLNGDDDICEAGVEDGDTLRIFPESIAGESVDQRARLNALIADHKDMQHLSQRNPRVTFETNRHRAPDLYTVTFHYRSFVRWVPGQREPDIADEHEAEIVLGAAYPRRAPVVTWQTPIFHPNIEQPHGAVCLGVLRERYLPSLGLARIVRQLAEMVQWRNFDAFNPFNRDAARWASNMDNWRYIEALGGHPIQGPIEQLLKQMEGSEQEPIAFRRIGGGQ